MSMYCEYDNENIFAKILRGEIPNVTVYEDEDVLSFMDVFPQSKGHTLIIPKNITATNFLNIPQESLTPLIVKTQMIAKAIETSLKPEGIRLMQFNGEAAGQTVFHIHFHLIPIWSEEKVAPHGGGQADTEELKKLAASIRSAL